jgi:predicted hydrocarbon binding protein
MEREIGTFHNVAYFIGALASACEKNLGKGSLSICALAGKKFGTEVISDSPATDDPIRAISILSEALKKKGIVWEFEPFSGERGSAVTEENGKKKIRLVFSTCMVRNALFRYSHEQKQSLCYMAHGVFAGAMEKVLTKYKADLDIIHAGPNACLKELTLEEKQ